MRSLADASSPLRYLPQTSSSYESEADSPKSLLVWPVPDGSGGDVLAEMRERFALPSRFTLGTRYDCASSTCERAASMRASDALRSRLLASASSTSAFSTGSSNAVHQRSSSAFCASVAVAGGQVERRRHRLRDGAAGDERGDGNG